MTRPKTPQDLRRRADRPGGTLLDDISLSVPDPRPLAHHPAEARSIFRADPPNPGSGLGDPNNLVIRPHPGGVDASINPSAFHEVFAADLDDDTAAVMAASQRPGDTATLAQPSGEPAWKTIPSWYLVATNDNTIPAATERFMAERAGATTVEVESSHVAMISHPRQVTKLILDTARSVG